LLRVLFLWGYAMPVDAESNLTLHHYPMLFKVDSQPRAGF
jgi:hypothetical protein